MKTPDENKCGMGCIRTNAERICVKPENGQCPRCEQLVEESLVRIHKLESTYGQVSKALCGKKNATTDELLQAVSQVKTRLAQVERERDAAVQTVHGLCLHCKNDRSEKCRKCLFWPSRVYFVSTETYVDHWEWRGVSEENKKEESNENQ